MTFALAVLEMSITNSAALVNADVVNAGSSSLGRNFAAWGGDARAGDGDLPHEPQPHGPPHAPQRPARRVPRRGGRRALWLAILALLSGELAALLVTLCRPDAWRRVQTALP